MITSLKKSTDLRCRVNYHALKFLPEIDEMADQLVARMRNRTGSPNPFMALDLRFEKGMVGLSFCDFVGTRAEKALMVLYRLKEWPTRFKVRCHSIYLGLEHVYIFKISVSIYIRFHL
ncbi:putative GDP-fucose protein O-fucosyltransferase [Helianthus annuus]|nr:putative GDP-fucose protein O-fucosyltransferase [Helianthus annuus]